MAILDSSLVFGLVLYKEELKNSITFNTLVNSIISCKTKNKITIIVFDNTPREKTTIKNKLLNLNDFIDVYYYTENVNKGLPFAYNLFGKKASELGKKWIVLLDQDTELPKEFFAKYLQADDEKSVHCPLVFNNGNLMSPSYYKNYRSSLMEVPKKSSISLKNVSCINSGLMVNVDFFQKIGGYNSKLFLDFCDHDFIYKVKKNNIKQLGIIKCELQQDFSSTNHTKGQAIQRYSLFLNDLRNFRREKNSIEIFFRVDLPRLLKLTYQYKSLKFLKIRFT